MIAQGYLTVEECEAFDWGKSQQYVDYEKVYQSRYQVLRLAFDRYPLKDDKVSEVCKKPGILVGGLCFIYSNKEGTGRQKLDGVG